MKPLTCALLILSDLINLICIFNNGLQKIVKNIFQHISSFSDFFDTLYIFCFTTSDNAITAVISKLQFLE